MKRVFLFIFLSILLLIIILERKSNFTVGTKYRYRNALAESLAFNQHLGKISKKTADTILSQQLSSFRLDPLGRDTTLKSDANQKLEKLVREKKWETYMKGMLKLIENGKMKVSEKNKKRYAEYKREETYENRFNELIKSNTGILSSLTNEDRLSRMVKLRMIDEKSGLMKAFNERDKALSKKGLLINRKTELEKIEKRKGLSDKNKKKMRKLDSNIEKATLKLETKKSEINKAKRKAENSRKKYNDKQKRKKKKFFPKISKLKSVSKKALKLGKKK